MEKIRARIRVRGAVQGVGFRPAVYRLASELKLTGWVNNSSQGVGIEVEGERVSVEAFLSRLQTEKPPLARILGTETTLLDPHGYDRFEVRESVETGSKSALILPDIATCPDCLREILDPQDRRYRYPFTNCTNCGPRFTILESLPYDRARTTMKKFRMCPACQGEYDDPADRRFHAQPNACPECGPQLAVRNAQGLAVAVRDEAFREAVGAVREGKILALKGLGGFHLIVDARNEEVVKRLRERKLREEKPLAVMYPNLEQVQRDCEVSEIERRALTSPESPIVLLVRKKDGLAANVAPGNPYLGVMLPYTPLHHLLMRELGFPVVATSGNLTDEPICFDEREAVERLGEIADLFLVHDRPIARYVDDSIVREMAGRETVLRRARGYAPLPLGETASAETVLAVGAHLKNTVAFSAGGHLFMSHHIGDLETPQAVGAFRWVASQLPDLYDAVPERVAHDLHPDYASTQFAVALELPTVVIQHHEAHVFACMADNDLQGSVLGVSWDGTGLGPDRTIWGGEFFTGTRAGLKRVAHLRTFRLPGGDAAIQRPNRSLLGMLHELLGEEAFSIVGSLNAQEVPILKEMLKRGLRAVRTSSAGRVFDAVASLLGIRHAASFEGQAAMELEFLSSQSREDGTYPCELLENEGVLIVDWGPVVRAILKELQNGTPKESIGARFHNTMAEAIVGVAKRVGEERVCLTGGCFQNKLLTERTIRRLREKGFKPYWHQRVPPNDGGIALGQLVASLNKEGT